METCAIVAALCTGLVFCFFRFWPIAHSDVLLHCPFLCPCSSPSFFWCFSLRLFFSVLLRSFVQYMFLIHHVCLYICLSIFSRPCITSCFSLQFGSSSYFFVRFVYVAILRPVCWRCFLCLPRSMEFMLVFPVSQWPHALYLSSL